MPTGPPLGARRGRLRVRGRDRVELGRSASSLRRGSDPWVGAYLGDPREFTPRQRRGTLPGRRATLAVEGPRGSRPQQRAQPAPVRRLGVTGMSGYSSRIVSDERLAVDVHDPRGASPEMASAQSGDSASPAASAGTPSRRTDPCDRAAPSGSASSGPGHALRDRLGHDRRLRVRDFVAAASTRSASGVARAAAETHDQPGVGEAGAGEPDLHGLARRRRHVQRPPGEADAGEGRGRRDAHVCPERPHGAVTLGAGSRRPAAALRQ